MRTIKPLILLTVFIDVIGMGIVIPILPFYVQGFTSSTFLITSLFAVYAIFSFLSAPVIGALSDKIGRRPMLILSIFSTAAGWIVFALGHTLWLLFLGRIIDGIAAGNLPIAQAYLTDISRDHKERSANLGLIGAIFGVAFIIGPLVGGVLGSISHTLPFWFVGVLAFLNGTWAFFMLPESHTTRTGAVESVRINPFIPLMRAVHNKKLRAHYTAWFFFGLAISLFQSIFALYLGYAFGFNEFTAGLLFGGMGIMIALNQGFALKKFWLKRFHEASLELGMLALYAVGLLLLGVPYLPIFIIAFVINTFGQSVLRVVMMSQIVAQTDASSKGETLGVTSSLTSLSMAIGPLVAGALFGVWFGIPFIMSALCLLAAFFVLYRKRKELKFTSPAHAQDVEMISEI